MTAEPGLLPLPERMIYGQDYFFPQQMYDYARANVAHATAAKDAEVEALRAEVAEYASVVQGYIDTIAEADAQAERLAEALRDLLGVSDKFTGDQDEDAAIWVAANDAARAALGQEGGK